VENGLLTDYRVLIMAVDENYARSKFSSIATDDAAKIIGCWNGLRKYKLEIHDDIELESIINLDESDDTTPDVSDFLKETLPMRRAVAFANTIEASQLTCDYFNQLSQENSADHSLFADMQGTPLNVQARHVDGTQSAFARDDALRWLRADTSENNCRILTNARCLSEGVDVPALDAVMFLKPRKSEIDIVQAVGRVMRKAEGKEYGYIILPIPVKPEEDAAKALHHNDKYQVVWDVLQALRSHDDRFDIEINQMELNQKLSNKIQIIGIGEGDDNDGNANAGKSASDAQLEIQYEWEEKFLEYRDAIFAKLVLKCGDREYWENWSKDVAEIAQRNIARLQTLLDGSNPDIEIAFNVFISNMQKTINPAINKAEAIELLSQHFITKPVFDALFGDYQFAEANPISQGLDGVVKTLQWLDVNQGFTEDAKNLQRFYEAVRKQVKGVTTSDGIERIAITLYEKFFQKAFPKAAERMGVVYTPIEIVDYILHSANHALQNEFGKCLADKDIHIIDPFTGTGTFISRLLKNKELIPDDALAHKYSHELHANEILLLAYYLANVNIENAYHDRIKNPTDVDMNDSGGVVKGGTSQGSGLLPRDREAKPLPPLNNDDNIYANLQDKPDNSYTPFEGIVLCDTFQLYEDGGKDAMGISQENSDRAKRQNNLPIKVIIGNPPYSAGQTNQNDNNQNLKYDRLDRAIENSYVKLGTATNKNSLYDSYIRSIRWASDKIKNHDGIICFVSNGGFINSNSADGLRKSLYGEFSKIYIYNLRGDARTQGEQRRKEKGNVFGEGTRTNITITLLIKNNNHQGECELHYHDIGDYLSQTEKLTKISAAKSYHHLTWQKIIPSLKGEWLNQASGDFTNYLALGSKDKNYDKPTIFDLYSSGVKTGRDGWAVNFSQDALQHNMQRMIDFYNQQCDAYHQQGAGQNIDNFVDNDATKISWSVNLQNDCIKNKQAEFEANNIYSSIYRPFTNSYYYFNRQMNERVYRQPNIYPTRDAENIAFTVTGLGGKSNFSLIITKHITDLGINEAGQAFPLYSYRSAEMAGDKAQPDEEIAQYDGQKFFRKCNITPEALQLFRTHYADTNISQEDIFYYCYGILHCKDYRAKYANDLKRELPHIPYASEFKAFMQAGRDLAALHLNYENLTPYDGVTQSGTAAHKRVTKMKFANKADKSTIIYNECITISNIPLEAYDYVVNGKSAIEWVMDRYTTNPALAYKASGNKNNPNDYAPNNPDYILNLLQSVITLSMQSLKIINALPQSVGAKSVGPKAVE
ncbi:MAG: damage-inducible protein, partial [Alphaproteobacteria bacterium]|nr:damage-inducible protein [Alphaproteobacteria bacterium]